MNEKPDNKKNCNESVLKKNFSKILIKWLKTWVLIALFCFTILLIYWGAAYNTTHYEFKITAIALIEDDIPPQGIKKVTEYLPTIIDKNVATWHVYNVGDFMQRYKIKEYNETLIQEMVAKVVYEQKYWFGLHVKNNVTKAMYDSITKNDVPEFNSSNYFQMWYQSGRDPTNFNGYILPVVSAVEPVFKSFYLGEYLPSLLKNASANLHTKNLVGLTDMTFHSADIRPFYDRGLLSGMQVGLIYAVLLTFGQVLMYQKLGNQLLKELPFKKYLIYRYGINYTTYFVFALFFSTVSAILQVDFTKTFGRAGFVVYWMSTFLGIAAVGGANDNIITLVMTFIPRFLPCWLLLWIVLNISATFYPMVLTNQFYRYGYSMPLHNVVEIYKVILLDLSKNQMGRNYGILVAWICLNSIILPFVLRVTKTKLSKIEQASINEILNKHSK